MLEKDPDEIQKIADQLQVKSEDVSDSPAVVEIHTVKPVPENPADLSEPEGNNPEKAKRKKRKEINQERTKEGRYGKRSSRDSPDAGQSGGIVRRFKKSKYHFPWEWFD